MVMVDRRFSGSLTPSGVGTARSVLPFQSTLRVAGSTFSPTRASATVRAPYASMRARSTTNVGRDVSEIGSPRRSLVTTRPISRNAPEGLAEGDGAGEGGACVAAEATLGKTSTIAGTSATHAARATLENFTGWNRPFSRGAVNTHSHQCPDSRIVALVLAAFPSSRTVTESGSPLTVARPSRDPTGFLTRERIYPGRQSNMTFLVRAGDDSQQFL